MIFLTPFLLLIAEIIWQITIGYPPTLEQLHIGVYNPFTLWVVRLFSLILILTTAFIFSQIATAKTKRYYWFLVLICPALSLLWMSYPLDSLKLFLVSGVFYLITKHRKNLVLATIVSTIVLLILNLAIFKQNPKILESLSLASSQKEVTYRFTTEDSLKSNIKIPTIVRRIGYNKFFIAIKNSSNEALTFFDFETLFFQEIHPLGQKAFVIFFWPEILIFCLSLWFIAIKQQKASKEILPLIFLAFIYFITTNSSAERRLILAMFPLAIIMSDSIGVILTSSYRKTRIGIIILILLSFYGWATNYFDRYIRPNYWLDNRPIAYDFFLSYLKNQNPNYNKILVPDTLFSTKDYCHYYLKKCDKIKFENFDLSSQSSTNDSIYIGFTRNFLGPNFQNISSAEISKSINNMGLEILKTTHILDNIASGYGQELIIVDQKR